MMVYYDEGECCSTLPPPRRGVPRAGGLPDVHGRRGQWPRKSRTSRPGGTDLAAVLGTGDRRSLDLRPDRRSDLLDASASGCRSRSTSSACSPGSARARSTPSSEPSPASSRWSAGCRSRSRPDSPEGVEWTTWPGTRSEGGLLEGLEWTIFRVRRGEGRLSSSTIRTASGSTSCSGRRRNACRGSRRSTLPSANPTTRSAVQASSSTCGRHTPIPSGCWSGSPRQGRPDRRAAELCLAGRRTRRRHRRRPGHIRR